MHVSSHIEVLFSFFSDDMTEPMKLTRFIDNDYRLANMKKFRAAIMDFRAALGLDPSNISARQYLETTIAQEEEHRLNVG